MHVFHTGKQQQQQQQQQQEAGSLLDGVSWAQRHSELIGLHNVTVILFRSKTGSSENFQRGYQNPLTNIQIHTDLYKYRSTRSARHKTAAAGKQNVVVVSTGRWVLRFD
jgi:hypothetical protein